MKGILFFFFLIISTSAFPNTGTGWSETYGGDGVVSEFMLIARTLLAEMERSPKSFPPEFTERLKDSIETTQLSSADRLYLDGVEKDALNHTLTRPYSIEISRERWLQSQTSLRTQEILVLHEYLFTLHIDDTDYTISNSYYMLLMISRMGRSPEGDWLGPYLLKAAGECNKRKIKDLIELGVNLNFTDAEGRNALYLAALSGCVDEVDYFLNMAVPGLQDKKMWDPWFAAFVGSLDHPEQEDRYLRVLKDIGFMYLDPDTNISADFPAQEFPQQDFFCKNQTMLVRSIIGIKFYTDTSHSKIVLSRNPRVTQLLQIQGASLDLKDDCGKSARDYMLLTR